MGDTMDFWGAVCLFALGIFFLLVASDVNRKYWKAPGTLETFMEVLAASVGLTLSLSALFSLIF